jgi:hypothetical protein
MQTQLPSQSLQAGFAEKRTTRDANRYRKRCQKQWSAQLPPVRQRMRCRLPKRSTVPVKRPVSAGSIICHAPKMVVRTSEQG